MLGVVYIIPIVIIGLVAYLFMFLGISSDITKTKFITIFIRPITYLQDKMLLELKK